jgi:hypothetical protein
MPPAEAARAAEILGRGEVDGTISANVFHTRHAANDWGLGTLNGIPGLVNSG